MSVTSSTMNNFREAISILCTADICSTDFYPNLHIRIGTTKTNYQQVFVPYHIRGMYWTKLQSDVTKERQSLI